MKLGKGLGILLRLTALWLCRVDYIQVLRVICHLLSVILVTLGVSLIYIPAGCIVAGCLLWFEAHGHEFNESGREKGV